MPQRMTRSILALPFLALVSATISFAQSSTSIVKSPVSSPIDSWQGAQLEGSSKGKLLVVTIDQPNRRQTCHIRSFTAEKLVCSRAIGRHRTFLPQQTLALILPGDGALRFRVLLWLNAGLGTAIWALSYLRLSALDAPSLPASQHSCFLSLPELSFTRTISPTAFSTLPLDNN